MTISRTALVLLSLLVTGPAADATSWQDRIDAAQATATSAPPHQSNACSQLHDTGFYWELGDVNGKFDGAFGTVDGTTVTGPGEGTPMSIASASKWMYATYIAEELAQYYAYYGVPVPQSPGTGEPIPATEVRFLTMTSGYHSLNEVTCTQVAGQTVAGCLTASNKRGGYNDDYTTEDDGIFWYNGGHFQKHATLGNTWDTSPHPAIYPPPFMERLGPLHYYRQATNTDELGAEVNSALGLDITTNPNAADVSHLFIYSNPMLAGGVYTTPLVYREFLHEILDASFQIAALLGQDAVCTNTNEVGGVETCPTSKYEPPGLCNSGESWHYSLGHWVEDDPDVGDGSFSSPGSRGFYPWIWKPRPGQDYGLTNPLYGMVARDGQPQSELPCPAQESPTTVEDTMRWESVECGVAIRRAFQLGIPQ